MATKDNGATPTVSEIGIIRDILMGGHIADYEKRFLLLEETIQKLDNATREREKVMHDEIKARFDKVEHLLNHHVEDLNGKMRELSKNDKNSLSDLLAEMGKRLKE